MYKLRDYQERTLTQLMDWLSRHPEGNPIVDACVGAGKSIIIAEFCKRAIAQYPQTRIIMCVASKELCQQNLEKLLSIWSEAPAGVCSASLGRKDLESQIIFATIGSIAKYAHEVGKVNLLLVDECHNVNPDNAGMYRTFISDLQKYGNKHLCVIGFTGTPFRGDGVWLWQGKDPLFAGTATKVTMDELLEQNYLSPLVVDRTTPETIDSSGIRTNMGDYVVKELNDLVCDKKTIQKTIDDLFTRGAERKKWLIFCVSIDHAHDVHAELERIGDRNPEIVTSKTPNGQRADILERFKLPASDPNAINCLVNVACLTTGFDAPETDLIALLRPTKSPVLYVQIAGRGMRIAKGKKDCLWLDYTSTTRDMGPVNLIKGRNRTASVGTGEAPFKYCLECGNPNPVHVTHCQECGATIPVNESDPHRTTAGKANVLHGFQPPEEHWFDIKAIGYYKHLSKSGNYSLRVDYYYSDLEQPLSEYWCFEHDGFALRMASQWWTDHMPGHDIPYTVEEALEKIHHPTQGIVAIPNRIRCERDETGKWWRIRNHQYGNDKQPKILTQLGSGNLF